MLHHTMGAKAIDLILPDLLNDLQSENENSISLSALQELMQVRGNSVFPALLPLLLSTPITAFNAKALGSLIKVSGASISKRLSSILPILLKGLEQKDDAASTIEETLGILLSNIYGDDAVHQVMTTLFEEFKSGNFDSRYFVCVVLRLFYENAKENLSRYNSDWLSNLLALLNGKEGENVLAAASSAISGLVTTIKKEDFEKYVMISQKALLEASQVLDATELLPGYNLTKVIIV